MNNSECYEEFDISIEDFFKMEKSFRDDWEVETPDGWQQIKKLWKKGKKNIFEINTKNKKSKVSEKHLFQRDDLSWDFVENFKEGDSILSKEGIEIVETVTNLNIQEEVFDITVDHENHRYYTDGLVSHNSGVGKSVTMLNLALNMMKKHKFNALYISLEMSEDAQAGRADAMISGIANRELLNNIDIVSSAVINASKDCGKFFIKRMPESTTTSADIRAYLVQFQQLHGFIPDIVVIDYLDLMTTNKKIALDNLFVKDKYVAEEVRSIAYEFKLIMISASQMGRGALEAETINQGHIQGGISKVNTVDNLIAILQNDMMKAAGEIVFELIKTRNSGGKGSQVLLRWNNRTLLITNNVDSKGQIIKNAKPLNPITIPDYVMQPAEIKKEPQNATNLLGLMKNIRSPQK